MAKSQGKRWDELTKHWFSGANLKSVSKVVALNLKAFVRFLVFGNNDNFLAF